MTNEPIMATIITYNPEIVSLCNNVKRIASQVDELIIYDNCSDNIADIEHSLLDVHIIKNESNIGLPINYNRAVRFAKSKGYKWLLIMDQDTLIPDNLITEYKRYTSWDKVAIICPQLWDINLTLKDDFIQSVPDEEFSYVDKCVSSASLNNVDVAIALGGFDEKMFIDYVDIDYCRNCKNHGYKIVRANSCIIEHQIGKSRMVNFLWKRLMCCEHPPIRKYYFFRNRIYYARKYKEGFITPAKTLIINFIELFYEDNTLEKIIQAYKGLIDGFKL